MIVKNPLNKFLHLKLAGFMGCFCISLLTTKTLAQQSNIIPDNTLGTESSRLNRNVLINGINADSIDGGALRDSNLFHSFSEFNINNGQAAYFVNPAGVANILTRVTGGNPSNILGTLGVDGTANLFLINTNGIVFGENASLDLQGSFVGTTASGIQFGEQGNFSATNPETPGNLTVNPSALFFNQVEASGGIINQSRAVAELDNNGLPILGLKVPDGKSLLLVGGDVNIDGGQIKAFGGNIELAGLSAPGKVDLNFTDSNISLGIPDGVERADVSFDRAIVNVRSDNGGDIKIYGRNVELARKSKLRAGINFGLGTPDSQGGDVVINATGDTTLIERGLISNIIAPGGFGKVGNVDIITRSFNSINSDINVSALGNGNAGNVNIRARDTVFLAKRGISSSVFFGSGNAGTINIEASSVDLSDGTSINADTFGEGNAGDIRITTGLLKVNNEAGSVELRDGASITNNIIFGEGKAGDIQVTTGSLKVSNEAFISSTINSGQGNTGNIIINAKDTVNFDTGAYALTSIADDSIGNGGDIQVTTGTLSLTNGAELSTKVFGGNAGNVIIEAGDNVILDGVLDDSRSGIASQLLTGGIGKAGDIKITAGSLFVTNGGLISNSTDGQGDAGNITINARDTVIFEGFGGSKPFNSEASSSVASNGVGNGGDITIAAGELLLKGGGNIRAINGGQGDGGNIFLDTRNSITFDGVGENGLLSRAETATDNGNAGFIQVQTGSLFLTNGGQMSSSLFKPENLDTFTNAGNITIEARDTVKFDGVNSGLNSILAGGVGKGGDIKITTGSLAVTNGAEISADTSGRGNGGNITIDARDRITFDGIGSNNFSSGAYTIVQSDAIGNAGIIKLTTDSLFLNNGGLLSTGTLGKGDAGEITVNANMFDAINGGQIVTSTGSSGDAGTIVLNVKDKITFSGTGQGLRSGLFASTSPESTGQGGSIFIDPPLVIIEDGAAVSVGSDGTGDAGDISLQAGTLQLDNGFITAQTASTQGGNIGLQISELLLLRNESQITTTAGTAQAGGDGGNIDINSKFIVAPQSEDSNISANAFTGNGGKVNITSQGIFGIESRSQPTEESDITASSRRGISGETNINQDDTSSIRNSFTELAPNIDTDAIIANSCIVRSNKRQENSFKITGSGGLRNSPGDELISIYSTGEVRNVEFKNQSWKKGDPIIEPQGLYRLSSGELLLSREC